MRRERTDVEKRVSPMFVADVPKRSKSDMCRLSTSRSSVKYVPVTLCAYTHVFRKAIGACAALRPPAHCLLCGLSNCPTRSSAAAVSLNNSCTFCSTYLTYVQTLQNASHPWHSGYAEHKLLHYAVKLRVQGAGFIFLLRRVHKVAKSNW
jgi:hypothetical protein